MCTLACMHTHVRTYAFVSVCICLSIDTHKNKFISVLLILQANINKNVPRSSGKNTQTLCIQSYIYARILDVQMYTHIIYTFLHLISNIHVCMHEAHCNQAHPENV